MTRLLLLASMLFLFACAIQTGRWTWRHPDAQYAERHRARDISECEEFAWQAEADGPFFRYSNARPYGGWGNFDFEYCMQQRGWNLEFVPGND